MEKYLAYLPIPIINAYAFEKYYVKKCDVLGSFFFGIYHGLIIVIYLVSLLIIFLR